MRPGAPFEGFNCHFGRRSDIWFVAQEKAFLVEGKEFHVD